MALKFYSADSRDCFEREVAARNALGGGPSAAPWAAIVSAISDADFSRDAKARAEELPGNKGLTVADYPFCLEMEQGLRSLDEAARAEQFTGRDVLLVSSIMQAIARCLLSVHAAGWIHGDVKPKNIMQLQAAGGHWLWKLVDFDAAARFGAVGFMTKGSTGFAPPEAARRLFGESRAGLEPLRASASFDVWSFGVLLFELCAGVSLFRKDINDDIIPADRSRLLLWRDVSDAELAGVFAGTSSEKQEQEVTEEDTGVATTGRMNSTLLKKAVAMAKDLIRRCLACDPAQRPSFKEILRHPFLLGAWHKADMQPTLRMKFHIFISHMQVEASGDVGTMFFLFEKVRLPAPPPLCLLAWSQPFRLPSLACPLCLLPTCARPSLPLIHPSYLGPPLLRKMGILSWAIYRLLALPCNPARRWAFTAGAT